MRSPRARHPGTVKVVVDRASASLMELHPLMLFVGDEGGHVGAAHDARCGGAQVRGQQAPRPVAGTGWGAAGRRWPG